MVSLKILYIIPYMPTLIRTRPYNIIRAMHRRGHQITLATLLEGEEEIVSLNQFVAEGLDVLAVPITRGRIAYNMLRAFFSATPLQGYYSWQPGLAKEIINRLNSETGDWDIIHIEHLRGAVYGLFLLKSLNKLYARRYSLTRKDFPETYPVIWDSVDCISLLFEQAARFSRRAYSRWITRLELPRTRKYEGKLVVLFDRTLVTSDLDKTRFASLALQFEPHLADIKSNIITLPNGVDLDYFCPIQNHRQTDIIVFSGKLSYHANTTAALFLIKDLMPIVWSCRPNVKVQLVGKDPPAILRDLAANNRRIEITGTVPDIRPYLQNATISVAPIIYGAGIQNKVLEAMACATPVVASIEAITALKARPGEEIVIANDKQGLASSILTLLENSEYRSQIGVNGRKYVEQNHDWNVIAGKLEDIYFETIRTNDHRRTNPKPRTYPS